MREIAADNRDIMEIDLQKLLLAYLRKWYVILICGVLAAGLTLLYTVYYVTPTYRTSVMIYVNNTRSDQQVETVSGSNLSAAARLVSTYVNIIKSDSVLTKVAEASEFKYSPETMRKLMTTEQVDDTEIFKVYITHPDPKRAAELANAIADVAPGEIEEIVEGSSTKIIDYAKVPTSHYSPNYERNTVLGGIVGVVVALVYITLRYLLDVRLKTSEDLELLFEAPVLGQIPTFGIQENKRSYGYDAGKTTASDAGGEVQA